jgi:hypothetical protein
MVYCCHTEQSAADGMDNRAHSRLWYCLLEQSTQPILGCTAATQSNASRYSGELSAISTGRVSAISTGRVENIG